jgi:predicted P-loop ATPase
MVSDFITLMAPVDGSPSVKRLYRSQSGEILSEPAPLVRLYRGGQVPVDSFARLAHVLETTSRDPAWYLVRGAIIAGVDRASMRRAHVTDPTLQAATHRWVLLDLDKWRLDVPGAAFAAAPHVFAEEARQALPEPFRGASCWWQATGSAGVKPGCRLRLAFWLSRDLGDAEIKAWVADFAVPVDDTLFTPSQPHFLGRPILGDGVADPVPGPRSGVLEGAPEVLVPSLTDGDRSLSADQELRKAARRIQKAEEGERRNLLNRVAFKLAARYQEDELPSGRLAKALLDASAGAGLPSGEAQATLDAAIRDGRRKGAQERAGWRGELARGKDDQTTSTAANVSIYMTNHPAFLGKLAFDERAQRPFWTETAPWPGEAAPRPVCETDEIRAIEWFQVECHMDVKPTWVRAGFRLAAGEKSFDPIQDYLTRLPRWDGLTRLGTFFVRHLGAPDTELIRAQTRAWFVQAIQRAYATMERPVQADYLIILSGPQGLRKSSLLRALCPHPRYFRDDLPDIQSKDARQAVADSWIIELSELTQRKADRDAFKAFITARVDKFRPPYGRDEATIARRAVMVGTTNEDEFLTDPSGNRRFWPLACTRKADIDEALAERDQLWAEAYSYVEAGDLPYLPADLEEEAHQVQDEHREEDSVEDKLEEILRTPFAGTPFDAAIPAECLAANKTITKLKAALACELVKLDPKNNWAMHRVKAALKRLKWKQIRLAGKRYWVPPVDWAYQYVQASN